MDKPIVARLPESDRLVFYGTDVAIASLIHDLTQGRTIESFLASNPTVTREQVTGYLTITGELVDQITAVRPRSFFSLSLMTLLIFIISSILLFVAIGR